MNSTSTLQLITQFLNTRCFAMIGISRNGRDFSRKLLSEFLGRGYEIIPVNPLAQEIQNLRCYPNVRDIPPGVSSALLMTPPHSVEPLLRECTDAGISLVWIYGVHGQKRSERTNVKLGEDLGIRVIAGFCPFMFLPSTSFFHRLHGAIWKLTGAYPT